MWKEYAVQPECLVQSWDGFRAIFHHFGASHGRWLAKYPAKNWARLVYDALEARGLTEIARQRIVESLVQGQDRMVNAGRPYDPALGWLPNAEAQQASAKPFDGIIASENPRTRVDVVIADDLSDRTFCFQSATDLHVNRTAAEMVACVRGLISKSKEVLLIDPHFGCLEPRFSGVLLEVVRHIHPEATRIEYHLSHRSLVLDQAEFIRRLKSSLSAILPHGVQVGFLVWEPRPGGEILHDRFILTELGGANFSVGLDEGQPGQTTKVSRLGDLSHRKLWQDYSRSTAAFNLLFCCTVAGSSRD